MKDLDGIISRADLPEVIADLEGLAAHAPVIGVAAINVLKNELAPAAEGERRRLVFEAEFELPGGLGYRLRRRRRLARQGQNRGGSLLGDLGAWLAGADAERFRDRCDRYFYEEMAPVIEANFDELADPFLNTINEAIINYAEHGFKPWALGRRVSVVVFRTEGNLAYGIVRPSGTRLRPFDPLTLTEKKADALHNMKRGWGHTLLMQRALFISFDQEPRRRGLMIVIGPESQRAR